jgi:hypothetical protein
MFEAFRPRDWMMWQGHEIGALRASLSMFGEARLMQINGFEI